MTLQANSDTGGLLYGEGSGLQAECCCLNDPLLCVTPAGNASFHLIQGTTDTDAYVYTEENCGGGTLTWNAALTGAPAWASIDNASGSLAAGETDDATVTVDATGLAAGTYTSTLNFTSNDGNTSRSITLLVLGYIKNMSVVYNEAHVYDHNNTLVIPWVPPYPYPPQDSDPEVECCALAQPVTSDLTYISTGSGGGISDGDLIATMFAQIGYSWHIITSATTYNRSLTHHYYSINFYIYPSRVGYPVEADWPKLYVKILVDDETPSRYTYWAPLNQLCTWAEYIAGGKYLWTPTAALLGWGQASDLVSQGFTDYYVDISSAQPTNYNVCAGSYVDDNCKPITQPTWLCQYQYGATIVLEAGAEKTGAVYTLP